LGGDRTGINSVILDGVRFDRDKVRFGSRDVKGIGFEQLNKLLGGLRDRIHNKAPLNGRMYARVLRPWFLFFLIGQNEEQPGKKD
jgi:hypothetical protein